MNKPIDKDVQSKMIHMEAGEYYWCACGKSATQPFCDGSHRGTDIEPLAVKIDQKQEVFWCMCKYSKNKPFCDGSHREL